MRMNNSDCRRTVAQACDEADLAKEYEASPSRSTAGRKIDIKITKNQKYGGDLTTASKKNCIMVKKLMFQRKPSSCSRQQMMNQECHVVVFWN